MFTASSHSGFEIRNAPKSPSAMMPPPPPPDPVPSTSGTQKKSPAVTPTGMPTAIQKRKIAAQKKKVRFIHFNVFMM